MSPKLSYYSLPAERPEPAGMATPPLRLPGAVPFVWEEAPGKPRRELCSGSGYGSEAAKCLDLPPRMAVVTPEEVKDAMLPSSTIVLDRPYELRRSTSISTCYSSTVGDERMFKARNNLEKHGWRRMRFWRKRKRDHVGVVEGASPTLSSSCSSVSSWGDGVGNGKKEQVEEEEAVKVNFMRMRRSRSLSSASTFATSHLWASIKGSLKQVVLWKRDWRLGSQQDALSHDETPTRLCMIRDGHPCDA